MNCHLGEKSADVTFSLSALTPGKYLIETRECFSFLKKKINSTGAGLYDTGRTWQDHFEKNCVEFVKEVCYVTFWEYQTDDS